MILYFDSKGQLREEISEYILQDALGNTVSTSFITTDGNISANKIFALFEGETPTKAQAYITYRMPNGNIYSNASIECDAVAEASIAYNAHRDLKMFQYGKIYRFMQFNLPSALLTTGGAGVYQANIVLYPDSVTAKSYPQFSFKAEGTPANLVVNEITDTQYSLILAMLQNFIPYSGAEQNVDLGLHYLYCSTVYCTDLNVRDSDNTYAIDIYLDLQHRPILRRKHLSTYLTYRFPIDEDGSAFTLATREWVGEQSYVPYSGATADLDLGTHKISLTQVDLSVSSGGETKTGVLRLDSSGYPMFGLSNGKSFLFPSDESGSKTIATRDWAKRLLTPSAIGITTTSSNVNGYNGAEFPVGASPDGLYVFTYGNCMVLLPVAGLVAGTEYKTASVLVGSGDAGFQLKVLTYRLTSENGLQIYQKENFIPTGWTAYLTKIALYS